MERIYSNGKVDRAGELLSGRIMNPARDGRQSIAEWDEAFDILSHWRAIHAYPLAAIASRLKCRAISLDPEAIVAQRLKRFPSIRAKLKSKENMALTQMQDIGGCRAVMETVEQAYEIKRIYEKHAIRRPDSGPQLIDKWTKDYILTPKEDGYRGVHFVMKYRTSDSSVGAHCNGLRVEIQLRSRLQHAWAMAVETASVRTHQALKAGEGRESWKLFFRLMASVIAIKEQLPLVPYTDDLTVHKRLRFVARGLKVIPLFEGMSHVVEFLHEESGATARPEDLYLLELNSQTRDIKYRIYNKADFKDAVADYGSVERQFSRDPDVHVVLVSVASLAMLKSAYPSFFLDTTIFVELIKEAVEEGSHR
jgi:ppGpp synthetase/RelA/SpoT-type nucleotidyltranferase